MRNITRLLSFTTGTIGYYSLNSEKNHLNSVAHCAMSKPNDHVNIDRKMAVDDITAYASNYGKFPNYAQSITAEPLNKEKLVSDLFKYASETGTFPAFAKKLIAEERNQESHR